MHGVAIVSLIGSLGAAGAAVTVTWYFLRFLREQEATTERRLSQSIREIMAIVANQSRPMEQRLAALEVRVAALLALNPNGIAMELEKQPRWFGGRNTDG